MYYNQCTILKNIYIICLINQTYIEWYHSEFFWDSVKLYHFHGFHEYNIYCVPQ